MVFGVRGSSVFWNAAKRGSGLELYPHRLGVAVVRWIHQWAISIVTVVAISTSSIAQYQAYGTTNVGTPYQLPASYQNYQTGYTPATYQSGTTTVAADGNGYYQYMPQIAQANSTAVSVPTAGTTVNGSVPTVTAPTTATITGDIQAGSAYPGDPYSLPTSTGGATTTGNWYDPSTWGTGIGVGKDYVPPTSSARKLPLLWFENSWVYAKKGPKGLSMDELSGRLAMPISLLGSLEHPIYFVPGTKVTWFTGPDVGYRYPLYGDGGQQIGTYYPPGNLPGSVYDFYTGFWWEPKMGDNLSFQLGVAPWLGTDIKVINKDSWRFPWQALATYRFSPEWAIKGGVYYTARDRYNWVPGGGLIWNPAGDDSVQIDLYYPDARLKYKFDSAGVNDLWLMIHGSYGGGRWTIKNSGAYKDQVDVSDLRILATLGMGEMASAPYGSLGIGWAFNREVRYKDRSDLNYKLKDGFVLSGELKF